MVMYFEIFAEKLKITMNLIFADRLIEGHC